jgi:hypothetical protein
MLLFMIEHDRLKRILKMMYPVLGSPLISAPHQICIQLTLFN